MKEFEFNGLKIKLGRTSLENDKLISESQQNWWWFHLGKLKSGHLVLESESEPDTETLNYCAQLVKEHSKFKNIYRVSVIYTQIRHVKKTDTPGQVTTKRTKSITI
jgi:predicted ribosome quality control (RQC) complex YloA/Tae2 family protein